VRRRRNPEGDHRDGDCRVKDCHKPLAFRDRGTAPAFLLPPGGSDMAHNLTVRMDGNAEMFYYGDIPWHGLGQRVERVLTSDEALRTAWLDWDVEKRPVFTERSSGEVQPISDHRAVVRTDTDAVLGIVSEGFRPIQNRE